MSTLQTVELGVLGALQVRQYGLPVAIPGAKPRAILTMLGLHGGSVVPADTLVELLWGDDPPRTAAKALQTHISSLRRTLGDGFVLTQGTGWTLSTTEIDASRYKLAAKAGREAIAAGDCSQAVARFDEAMALWRGVPELIDSPRGTSEKTRWIEGHAALVEDRADALLATGRAAEIIGELEAAVGDAPLRERRWGQLMLALYRAGRQGEALGAYQRARSLLADELGVDPGPDLRRLEAAIVAQDEALEVPAGQQSSPLTRAVTFLLTDIEGSTGAWEADASAMAVALARHDELVEQVVTSRGGRLVKTRGEGDATFSVFDRPSAAAAAAIELQEQIFREPWKLQEPIRIRVALHTGEVELRDGDYFGRAVNRAARLRSLAQGGQILCSGATAELVMDSLPDDVLLADLGMRHLRNLARPEHVFELRLETPGDQSRAGTTDSPMERPGVPAVLASPGPFVGRGIELERLLSVWQAALGGGTHAVLIAGEPGVGKTRLAGEWSRQAYEQGAVILYGRCDEDLGAPYQPFAEALRSLMPCLSSRRLRAMRGVEALLPMVPGLADVLPDLAAPPRADPDTERYALFDAVVALLVAASDSAPIVLILDDLHWAAKSTLLMLRHLLRFGEQARVQIVGTYRSTDLDRTHPLAAMLADLHRDGSASRLQLSGLDENDVSAYVAEAGYDDEELARALASVTGGNPFFLIEALRHVDESGGRWDPSTLPQGVREAVSRRLSRLPVETNKALAAAAVVGGRFALDLVERVVGDDLVDAFDEACKAGILVEEPGGRYRFNHALVRQSLLAELASVRRMRLHQRIATTLEAEPGSDDELLAELAHHYFECAWAGNAAKAVEYCRRAADQAMARLAYEGAADLYDRALHAIEELDDELPDRDDQQAELLVARCEALLAAGDVVSAAGAVAKLQAATGDSARLAAWGTCFSGQLSMLTDPERLDDIESALTDAAERLAELDDAAGEAKAHTVRATCLARLGRIGDCEMALDHALTAARRAREHRRVNAVLANAPLAALWGPNPVSRAGGRCLDVVRLLRITTGSPVVEATSTRCQAVLDALRGRAAAARGLIESARRTLTELGLRHALLEVDHFAGIVELVADDPAAAETHLRRAYEGFRRMGLDADTAETSALLAQVCLERDREAEADELCTQSEHLAGHALKASIAWRTVRARLLARDGDHAEAKRVAEEAVALAERTDLLVDHGDACLTLATVLNMGGDAAGARAAAQRAAGLYELKGAAALVDKARRIHGERELPTTSVPTEPSMVEPENACVRAIRQLSAAIDREAWAEYEQMFAPNVVIESRRKIVGFYIAISSREWAQKVKRLRGIGAERHRLAVIAVRGERLALTRLEIATDDGSPAAPLEEVLELQVLDENGRFELGVFFDVEDIDAAIAELDATYARLEKRTPRTPLDNAATRADDRLNELFTERRWDEIGSLFADNIRLEDRRRGLRNETHDRGAAVAAIRAIADTGTRNLTSDVLAVRGERLALVRTLHQGRDTRQDGFASETLVITEVDADGLMVALIAFDTNDFDEAIAELDARYLAGEAAPHARTWSVITAGNAALNDHKLSPTTPDFVNIDHRPGTAFAPGELIPYVRSGWDLDQNIRTYVERVHRVSDLGAVFAWAGHGTSHEGFAAEWRGINLVTVEDEKVNRSEVFDERDLDTALAKFDELNRPAPRLENAASRVDDRFAAYFVARDWEAISALMSDEISVDDRRRVVNAGLRRGRDVEIASVQAIAHLGVRDATSAVVATRGEHLALTRKNFVGRDDRPEAFHSELLCITEIDPHERVVARVVFDPDDIDAAFDELDARYLAGEAAADSQTWSVIVRAPAALNRREFPPTTPDWVNIDHRRGLAFEPGDLTAYVRAAWNEVPDLSFRIEAVHRLSNRGAVYTLVLNGTSHNGFAADWRMVAVMTVENDLISRTEMFEEADIHAALARFDEVTRPPPRLENAATHIVDRYLAHFADRHWGAMAEMLADDFSSDDSRPVVNAGTRNGRDAEIANMRAWADVGITHITFDAIAIRGDRLVLGHAHWWGSDQRPDAFLGEAITIGEVNGDNRIVARVMLDLDDIDAAFEELDARYLAGEAVAYAHAWSVIAQAYAAANRRELPATTPDFVNVDHRPLVAIESGNLIPYLRDTFEDVTNISAYVEAVHRLTELGAVSTHVGNVTRQDGFEAEWRVINVVTVGGDLLNRVETFAESDIDAALARFDELNSPRLENTASRKYDHFIACLAAHDWENVAEILADDFSVDDRRRVVNAGVRHGRDAAIFDARVIADVGITDMTAAVIATRGERLILARLQAWGRDPEAVQTEVLHVVEMDAGERFAATVVFDLDDIDAAFEELDARYLAGEAAPHAHTWAVVAGVYAAFNRGELPAADWTNVDHRRGTPFATSDLTAAIRAWMELTPECSIRIEAVHRLNDFGAVITHASHGISREGFDAEWRMLQLLMVQGDRVDRCELFDEGDLDAAVARFDELNQQVPRLENAATRALARAIDAFNQRDVDSFLAIHDGRYEDRRKVMRDEGALDAKFAHAMLLETPESLQMDAEPVAIRGQRLGLNRVRWRDTNEADRPIAVELLNLMEVNPAELVSCVIFFDPDDIDAAIGELTARWIASGEVAHPEVIEAARQSIEAYNRHDWDAMAEIEADATYVNHRQLSSEDPETIVDHWLSIRTLASLIPDMWVEPSEVFTHSAAGMVSSVVVRGTTAGGAAIELPAVILLLFDGDRVTRMEAFDPDQRDLALSRFQELHQA